MGEKTLELSESGKNLWGKSLKLEEVSQSYPPVNRRTGPVMVIEVRGSGRD